MEKRPSVVEVKFNAYSQQLIKAHSTDVDKESMWFCFNLHHSILATFPFVVYCFIFVNKFIFKQPTLGLFIQHWWLGYVSLDGISHFSSNYLKLYLAVLFHFPQMTSTLKVYNP